MGQWQVWEQVFKEVGEELVEIEVSFFEEETLKGDNVRVENSRLYLFLFYLFSYFQIVRD